MKRIIIFAAIMLACGAQSYAQTPTVEPNTPVRVGWTYPAPTGTNFSILVDGVIVKNFSSAELTVGQPDMPAGTWPYEATMPGIAPGRGRRVRLRAYIGSDPTQLFSDTEEILVDVLPAVPGGFRIILTPRTDGGIEVELRAPGDGDSVLTSTSILKFPSLEKK